MTNRFDATCNSETEELVHRFLDGELALEEQARVFSHLASCTTCRRTVNEVMRFRQILRHEHLPVPPVVDESFFRRLEHHKIRNDRRDRADERRPLWQTRRLVSLRAAVVVGAALLGLGVFLPSSPRISPISDFVRGETERVEFRDVIYVIYPGVTVEAPKLEL